MTINKLYSFNGWSAPVLQEFLDSAINNAAQEFFGAKYSTIAEGGSIPLMNLLQELWPKGQFMITGVLGPLSNAHGPNEFLHLEYTRRITCCMAYILGKVSEHVQQQQAK